MSSTGMVTKQCYICAVDIPGGMHLLLLSNMHALGAEP